MTPCEITQALIADKAVPAARKQFVDLQAAIHAALRKRDGVTVVTEGAPARWQLKEAVYLSGPARKQSACRESGGWRHA
jgi:hypothetical protein